MIGNRHCSDQLAIDAATIAGCVKKKFEDDNKGRGFHHTMLCVTLRTKHSKYRKFCFCNHLENSKLIDKTIVQEAEKRGYAVIITPEGHAEASFLQYILARAQAEKTAGYYTHIVGLGCSRPICKDCDELLKRILNQNTSPDYSGALRTLNASGRITCHDILCHSDATGRYDLLNAVTQGRQQGTPEPEGFLKFKQSGDYVISNLPWNDKPYPKSKKLLELIEAHEKDAAAHQ